MSRPRSGVVSGAVPWILTATLALLPLAISRRTLDSSEFPKTLVLTAGAL
ncbi:MAG: hypothetical protein HY568_00990, partial [Candidatus Latescibacteria bacterium]|nr:hypothetical protein [Candidatus Latescibacterota bacterium]